MKSTVFIPTAPIYQRQIEGSLECRLPLEKAGYDFGLMLVLLKGRSAVNGENKELAYANLRSARAYGAGYDAPIITMLANTPIKEIDFLHNTKYAAEHVIEGINFARYLPIGRKRILTFHLNSLVTEEDFKDKNASEWDQVFKSTIKPALRLIAAYGSEKKVDVLVESVPVPEYGDVPLEVDFHYLGEHISRLRNPFYLTGARNFEQIRSTGLGICLDVSHNRTIYRAVKRDNISGLLHAEDTEILKQWNLWKDVLSLESGDLVHLNDGDGDHDDKEGKVFRESLTLGTGDISNLEQIVEKLNLRKIPFVLEINEEPPFVPRTNTLNSIEYLAKMKTK